ncbi:restriction endonuclease subunit S [Streptomyces sp. NPDC058382]|uniref:restriction endonuclease subunit S n=1 Tax=unclassified Streptomyces TaxID=2593676 RepID=UPI003630348E
MTDSGAGESVASAPGERLPEGWVRATLGDLITPASGRRQPTPSDNFPYLGMDNVESHTGRVVGFGDSATIKSSSPVVQPGYLLYGRLRPYLNKVTVAEFAGICSGEFIVFPSVEGVDSRFLLYRMLSPDFVHYVMEKNPTGDRPRAHWEQFSDFPILLPPLPEQCRIVAKLDEQLALIRAGEASLREVERLADEFFRALLREAFSGRLVTDDFSEGKAEDLVSGEARSSSEAWDTPSSWIWSRLGSLFRVSVGSTPSRGNPDFWSGDIPWVSSGEVSFKRISETREFISRESISKPENRIHPPGTVMLAMIGEGKTRGQSAILDIPAAHNQNCASIRVSETEILPEFIYQFLVSRYEETRTSASGGNQPALNKAKVERILVPVPPLGTQRRIVDRLADLEQERAALRAVLAESYEQASALRGALFNAAFTGALVPQDPTDEPASALLDRIRAQRQAAVKPARKRALRKTTSKPASSGQEELSL